MKIFYFFLNFILLLALVFLLLVHGSMERRKPEKSIKKTPRKSSLKITNTETIKGRKLPTISAMWKKNLFDPFRGNMSATPVQNIQKSKNDEMELVGIFCFGKVERAIIEIKQGSRALKRIRRSSARRHTSSTTGQATQKKPAKRSYSTGERLNNGYVLEEILKDKVVLLRGNSRRELELKYSDTGSSLRIARNVAPPKPAAIEQPTKQNKKPSPGEKLLPAPPQPPQMDKNNANENVMRQTGAILQLKS